jgi:EAL domain-containing protein (putative c-di-GMP-specific phosphodiesterase class I)
MADTQDSKVGGLRAVELYYRVIRDISNGVPAFLHTQTRLNAPALGVLYPEQFRDVAEITFQCVELFWLELEQAMDAVLLFEKREIPFQWISVYMPVRALREVGIEHELMERFAEMEVPTNRICFELSEKLLEETDGLAAGSIRNLRNRGFHFMLSGFGGDNCPLMRLSSFEVDYVMLSAEVMQYVGLNDRADSAVKSIIDFVNGLGAEPIADAVVNAVQAERLHESGCNYCAGSLAGRYIAERYMRRKDDKD